YLRVLHGGADLVAHGRKANESPDQNADHMDRTSASILGLYDHFDPECFQADFYDEWSRAASDVARPRRSVAKSRPERDPAVVLQECGLCCGRISHRYFHIRLVPDLALGRP